MRSVLALGSFLLTVERLCLQLCLGAVLPTTGLVLQRRASFSDSLGAFKTSGSKRVLQLDVGALEQSYCQCNVLGAKSQRRGVF